MPTTRVYRSTDAGAPVLERLIADDAATSMMALFNSCLVAGYGAHAAAGWTRPYKDATRAVFKQGGGSGEYLYMLDDTSVTPSPRFIGYETMSAIDTGTNPYPAAGAYTSINYQATAGGIAMPWIIVADDRTFYFYHRDGTTSNYTVLAYGDGYSYQSSGLYRTFLSSQGFYQRQELITGATAMFYTPRDHLGAYNSTDAALSLSGDNSKGVTNRLAGLVPYPHGPDQKIWLAPLELVAHTVPAIRMRMRGFWHWLHDTAAVADEDVFPGVDDMVGKDFLIIRNVQNAGSVFTNVVIHETSSTWDTNS